MASWQQLLAMVSAGIPEVHKPWFNRFLLQFGSAPPSLNELWSCMDEVWDQCLEGASNRAIGLASFYGHPIWQINGIFIEQDPESILHREQFASWVSECRVTRIADYGGGFGTLARTIAALCNECDIQVIDPYPSQLGAEFSRSFANIKHTNSLRGKYDIILAVDVLEHLDAPLDAVLQIVEHTSHGGRIMLANCFHPVIKCHLPQTFYLESCLDVIMKQLGCEREQDVAYGHIYKKLNNGNQVMARLVNRAAQIIYNVAPKVSLQKRDYVMRAVLWQLQKVPCFTFFRNH
jgi:SAM-dependent methyltransferase